MSYFFFGMIESYFFNVKVSICSSNIFERGVEAMVVTITFPEK
jgi:hypothetical protein